MVGVFGFFKVLPKYSLMRQKRVHKNEPQGGPQAHPLERNQVVQTLLKRRDKTQLVLTSPLHVRKLLKPDVT